MRLFTGVISIHNLPIADAVGQRGNIRFVPARGEAGSVTMADAHGRFSGLGVALTSTGAGAGNAVGALVEAMNAARRCCTSPVRWRRPGSMPTPALFTKPATS
nr:thiamine pyrophosphate enzyme [Raoultella sp. NCTC 9187]